MRSFNHLRLAWTLRRKVTLTGLFSCLAGFSLVLGLLFSSDRPPVGASTPQDGPHTAAQALVAEAKRLRSKQDDESLHQALAKYEASLPLWVAAGDSAGEAAALNGIGTIYYLIAEPQKALDFFQQGLVRAERSRDRIGEGDAVNGLGRVYRSVGEYQQALDAFDRALQIARALKNPKGEAATVHNIALTYYQLGNNEEAIKLFDRVLKLDRTQDNRDGEGLTLTNMGLAYSGLGNHRKALELHLDARRLNREIQNRRHEASALHNAAQAYAALGNLEQALEAEESAAVIRKALGDRRATASSRAHIAALLHALGDSERAVVLYREVLPDIRAVKDSVSEAVTLSGWAKAERSLGHLDEARGHIEMALNTIGSLRSRVAIHDLRASYFASVQKEFEFYIDLLMQLHTLRPTQGFDAEALRASERARARSLVELIVEGHGEIRRDVDRVLLGSERAVQQRLNAKAKLLSEHHAGDKAAIEREVDRLMTELREIEGQIRANSPRYAALTQPQPLTAREIQERLLDGDTLLLEYSLGEERSYVWAVSPSTLTTYELPGRAEIEAAARRVYGLLTARQRGPGDADAEYWRQAAALSRTLLEPVASQLGTKRLLIVADGALQYLPFAALPRPAGVLAKPPVGLTPLMVDHEIISLPSTSTLAVLRGELAGRRPAAKAVAVLADAVFDEEDERVGQDVGTRTSQSSATGNPLASELTRAAQDVGSMSANGYLPRLLFARREAEAILSLTSSVTGLKALDFQASRETATSGQLGHYRIVHFATHGFLNSERPELSGIVLSLVDQRGAPQDGFLRLHDVYNLNLPAELVVLSACQSALGKAVKGEGLVGLTRGFMYAGAARVMASLWNVDDVATAELMKRFYEGVLRKGLSPAAALRQAQLALWKQGRWAAPYYWSAFVLQGEWRGWGSNGKRAPMSLH